MTQDSFAENMWAALDEDKQTRRTTPPTPDTSPATTIAGDVVVISDPTKYANTALQRAADEFGQVGAANQHEGAGRNHALNTAAFTLGRLVAAGLLTESQVRHALTDAASRNGLLQWTGHHAVDNTISSGLRAGALEPLRWTQGTSIGPVPEAAPFAPPGWQPQPGPLGVEREPNPLSALNLQRLAEPCPPPDWLVTGRLTRNTLTVLGSKPGVGKSWTALDLALAITTGRPWLGHDTIQGRVLYIDVENGETLATRRLQQLGADPDEIGDRLHYVTESVMFPGGEDSARFKDTLEAFRPDLVIVDTLASAAPSAEKDTESMSLFLYDIWQRSRQQNAAVLILAHLRKSQQGVSKDDPLDSFRGAGHLVGAASRAWLLEPRGAERFALRDIKAREFQANPTVLIRIHDEPSDNALIDKRTSIITDGEEEDDTPESDALAFQRKCLELIDNSPLGKAKKSALLTLRGDKSEATVTRWLKEFKDAGVLKAAGTGFYTRATEVPNDPHAGATPFDPWAATDAA